MSNMQKRSISSAGILEKTINLVSAISMVLFAYKLFFGSLSWSEEYEALLAPFVIGALALVSSALLLNLFYGVTPLFRKLLLMISCCVLVYGLAFLGASMSSLDSWGWLPAYFLCMPYVFLPFLGLSIFLSLFGWYDYFAELKERRSN
jgi:hypothetical protein